MPTDLGWVSEVRVLQGGRVVTGIAGDGHRVYVQYQRAGAPTFEGECSCGERSPCVHVAAVVMAAAKISGAQAPDQRRTDKLDHRPSNNDRSTGQESRSRAIPSQPGAPLRQSLCYLIEPDTAGGFRLSAWVTHSLSGSGHGHPRVSAFAPRITEASTDYPRYVDPQDREILRVLGARQFEGPWTLNGSAGFEVLERALATGRAYWRSLQGRALREAGARDVPFAWQPLANGDQRLRGDTLEPLEFLLQLEPAAYIDMSSGDCGPLQLPYPVDLLRHYWNRGTIDPAKVSACNSNLEREPRAERFPRLREMTVRARAPCTPRPRLVLSAAPAAAVQFIYDGMAVDSDAPSSEAPVVRRRDGDVVYEFTRDLRFERELQMQFDGCLAGTSQGLAGTPQSGEAWLAFMMNGVPSLRALGWEINVDPQFPYRIAAADDWYADVQTLVPTGTNRSAGATRSREWFDLRLGVLVDGHTVNVLPALVRYLQGTTGRDAARQRDSLSLHTSELSLHGSELSLLNGEHLLIRLEDGRYLPVPLARIQRIADALVEFYDWDGLNEHQALRLPAGQAGRLAQLALAVDATALHSDDPMLLNLIDAFKSFSSIEPLAAPAHFPASLRPYQAQGLGWLQFLRRHGLGGILADDMGLGKTVQTLAHLATEKQQGRLHQPSLIVAPVSVLGNWQQEILRFAPELRLLTLHGSKRKELYALIDAADLILIGYPLLLLDSDVLRGREFCFVILDEAQTIKNSQAKVSQAARALRAQHRLCLTGTPMENHLGELWSLFDFVQPGLLGDRETFQRHYRTPIESAGDTRRAAALSRRVQPFMLRRTKDAVAQDLPPKIQIVEPIELDERQRDFYDGIRLGQHRRVREAIEQRGLASSRITVLDALLKLRQACCDPQLIETGSQTPVVPSAKLDWLSSTLPELIAEGRRILLFSQFTSMLRRIEVVVRDLSIPYCLLTGETQQRTELVQRFQAGGVPLFLISLKAGGTGLNLTAADTIIHYDPWWNPAVEAQATDRAHRIGQDKPVFVYKLIVQRTIEEKIMQLQADKHALVSQLFSDESGPPLRLSSAELEALFAP